MATYICSFERASTRYYFDFSTVVDAPTTHAMTLAEYEHYYRQRYGEEGMRELPARLERADDALEVLDLQPLRDADHGVLLR